jgi:hypothetical protein
MRISNKNYLKIANSAHNTCWMQPIGQNIHTKKNKLKRRKNS